MAGYSRTSCTYCFFLGINISNAVHPTINQIPTIELWHNQTRMNKMLNWIVPVYTGVYYSFLYLLFYFPITSSIERLLLQLRERKRVVRILWSHLEGYYPYNYPWLFLSLAWPLEKMWRKVGEMADTTGRIPLWLIGTVAGIAVIGLVGVFFYGSYSGLGSSL